MAYGERDLIFPVAFDLQKAVSDASGDVDKVLRRMEATINSRPLTIRPKIDEAGLKDLSNRLANLSIPSVSIGSGDNAFTAAKGSINALTDAMQKCIAEWNQLAESERIVNRESGEYTTKAQQIIARFAELTAASNTFAKTLQQAAKESKNAADAEIKRNQKAAEQVAIMSNQERTLDQVNSKTKILTRLMGGLDKSDSHWKALATNLERVRQKQSELQAVQKAELAQMQSEYTSVKQLVSALQNYGGTIGQIQVKLSAFKSALNNTNIGSAAFREAALQIKAMNAELQRANQLVQNYQAKSLQGVGKKNTDAVVRQMEQYQQRIRQIDAQMNLAHAKGQDMGSQQMIKLLQERINLEEKLKGLMITGADLAKQKLDAEIAAQQKLIEETARRVDADNKKRQQEAEALAAQQKKAAEEERIKQKADEAIKRILKEQIVSYDTLTQKIKILETARNKTDIGAKRWSRLTAEINKTRESLKVITDEIDKVAKRSERLARLREILAMSTQSMAGLNARLQEANAQLQKADSGTATFERLALKVARLSEEYQKVQQYAQDFAQKAFQGLSAGDTSKRVAELQHWRQQLQQVEEEYNRLRNYKLQNGSTTAIDKQINALLEQRKNITKQIAQATMTAEQQQAEREKEINRIIEARNAKQKKHNDEVRAAVQARKQERTMLNAHERSIDNITKKLQHWQNKLNSTSMKSADFTRIAKEVERLTKKLEEARVKMAEMTGQSTSEFSKQETYLSRLIKRMAVYASVNSIGNFLTKIREVTAQFELQRISLGAILQDQSKANLLFSEIKSFALTSPVSILDLTKYTKQLAAYKIGYDELFETTKKLTDVSVGLGVSMDRVVLAYGQTRATGYLRASEIRQFTEMGVPIVEELATKLSKMNGELVTAAQVMDMVSKRGISFELVKEVFDDMTSAGGIFYNMQEKQGNTLFGMWAKLGDAVSIMYDQIGNTGIINSAMKTLINSLTWLMKNWRLMIGEIGVAVVGFGAFKLVQSLTTVNIKAASIATRDYVRAQIQLNAVQKSGSKWAIAVATASKQAALANMNAARTTNLWTAAQYRLKAALLQLKATLMGNWVTLALTAVATAIVAIGAAIEKATRLNRKINELKNETSALQAQSVRNFEHLAKAATSAADGSKAQKDALDELSRTYGEALSKEALTIENLRKLEGGYNRLTRAIRENVAAKQADQMRSAINEEVGAKITSQTKGLREILKHSYDLSEVEIDRFILEFSKRVSDTGKVTTEIIEKINEALHLGLSQRDIEAMSKRDHLLDPNHFQKLAKSYLELEDRMRGVDEWYRQNTLDLGKYDEAMQLYQKTVESQMTAGSTMLQNQQNINMQVRHMGSSIKNALNQAGITWQKEWENVLTEVNPDELYKTTTLNMGAILSAIDPNKYPELHKYISTFRDMYDELIPPSPTVQQIRANLFAVANSTGANIDKMRQFLWDGKKNVDEYLKNLNEQVAHYKEKIKEMQTTVANSGWLGTITSLFSSGKIEDSTKILQALEKQVEFVKQYVQLTDTPDRGGNRSDNRLQELQEINQTLEKINKEYGDLEKKEGKTKALEDIKKQFKDTLDYTNRLGKKFGLHFDFPAEFESLQQYRQAILNVMKSLKDLKGGEKAILEFQTMIAKADSDKLQEQIENQLKDIADKISRTKIAKEFYENILTQTGDEELALRVTYSVYPESGKDLYTDVQEQIRRVFDTGDVSKNAKLGLRLDSVFDDVNERINYRELDKVYAEFQNDIIERNRATARKLIAEGQKASASQISTWKKELAKAKDYEAQRTDIINRETQRRAEIYKSNLPQEEKDALTAQSQKKQDEDLAKVNFEEFTKSADYVRIFENLDNVTTSSLKHLRTELEAIIQTNKDLSPENMKTLVKAMSDIDTEINGRGFGKVMVQSVKDYTTSLKNLKLARQELAVAEAEYDAQLPQLDADIATAKAEEIEAQNALNLLRQNELATGQQIVTAELRLESAKKRTLIAEQKKAKAAKKVLDIENKIRQEEDKQTKLTGEFFGDLENCAKAADNLASILGNTKDLLGIAEDSTAGIAFDSAITGLQQMSKLLGVVTVAQTLYNTITESNPWMAIAAAVLAVTSALAFGISAAKVAKANKEIEKQSDLLDELQYAYNRLEASAEKLFGGDYVNNYNQRLRSLAAQQEAYLKQAEAERSKGKKADKEKIKEYEDQARDTADEIKDMQDELIEHFTGSSRTDLARKLAQSWIDARASMSDTFAAIKSDYKEMIKTMVVEGAAARVIENAMNPMLDAMSEKLKDSDIEGATEVLTTGMDKVLTEADNGMEILWKSLEAHGYNMKELISDAENQYSGIAKNISGATSEEINNVAAIGNTLMYYVSPIPRIDENLARVVALIENGGAVSGATSTSSGWTDWQQQAMDNYIAIQRNTADTVVECRRAAEACERITKLIKTKGSTSGLNVFLNS